MADDKSPLETVKDLVSKIALPEAKGAGADTKKKINGAVVSATGPGSKLPPPITGTKG